MSTQPEFIYVSLILPSLFALSLMGEGVHKAVNHESYWVPLFLGTTFLVVIVGAFFMLFVQA